MNYHNELLKLIASLDHKPTLLLHSCCAPCSSYVISFLYIYFDITILYYNPNIEPIEEYEKRKMEQIRFIKEFDKNVKFLDIAYSNEEFESKIKGLELCPEGGERCHKCYELRLDKTALMAKQLNFEYFGTTLTVSPYKNSKLLNGIGFNLEKKYNIEYLYSDFKKNDGYKKSIFYSREYNLYRQTFCGCKYSQRSE